MIFISTLKTLFNQRHLSFTLFIAMMLIILPIESVINIMELRPYYSLQQLCIEGWRLLSGHFVHASWPHLFVNLLNVVLLRFVFREWIPSKLFMGFIIFSALFISAGLWTITNFSSYVGFSGIFHGLLIYLLLLFWPSSRFIFSIAIACLAGKIIYEQFYGASPALIDFIGVGVSVESHALGFASGLLFYLAESVLKNRSKV